MLRSVRIGLYFEQFGLNFLICQYFASYNGFTMIILVNITGALREEVKAKSGDSISLPCIINRDECGDFHSIKWYKENRRVFVYSPIADFAKAEGELLDR